MIRFTCPTCKSVLQSPGPTAGSKVACPKCGQRLLVPNPVKPAASNKTVLGEPVSFPNRLGDVRAAEEKATLPPAAPTPVTAPAPVPAPGAFRSSEARFSPLALVVAGVVLLAGAYIGLRVLDYEIKVYQEESQYQDELKRDWTRKYEPRYKPVFHLFPF